MNPTSLPVLVARIPTTKSRCEPGAVSAHCSQRKGGKTSINRLFRYG
jgi:hypothetical protein